MANKAVEKIIRIYNQNFNEDKDEFKYNDGLKNYTYLVNNYRNLNKRFLDEKDIDINKEIDNFISLTLKVLDNFRFPLEKVWGILYAYNLYKLYGFKINNLSVYEINLLINLYMGLDDKYSLSSLDNVTNFIFDDDIKKNLYNANLSLRDLTNLLLEIVDFYLEEGLASNIPLSYLIKKKLSNVCENRLNIITKTKLNWNTPEDIYNNIEAEVKNLANLMINSKDEKQKQEGYELVSNLDMLICKLKNMSEEDYKVCKEAIQILVEDKDREILEKYYLIFSLINQFTTYNSIKNIK